MSNPLNNSVAIPHIGAPKKTIYQVVIERKNANPLISEFEANEQASAAKLYNLAHGAMKEVEAGKNTLVEFDMLNGCKVAMWATDVQMVLFQKGAKDLN